MVEMTQNIHEAWEKGYQVMTRKSSAVMKQRLGWLGFDGRTFLTRQEHETYCRRWAVRYAPRPARPGATGW
jgi:hypothetical protein